MKRVATFIIVIGIAFNAYSQFDKGSWFLSGSGMVGFGGYKYTEKATQEMKFNNVLGKIIFSTRNGFFVIDKLAVGLDIQHSSRFDSWEPDPNENNELNKSGEHTFFVGPLGRYYIPAASFLAIAPEVSFGYRYYIGVDKTESDAIGKMEYQTQAGGFGFNTGVVFVFQLSDFVAIDLSYRFGGGKIKGEWKDMSQPTNGPAGNETRDVELKFGTHDILLGIQILLGNK